MTDYFIARKRLVYMLLAPSAEGIVIEGGEHPAVGVTPSTGHTAQLIVSAGKEHDREGSALAAFPFTAIVAACVAGSFQGTWSHYAFPDCSPSALPPATDLASIAERAAFFSRLDTRDISEICNVYNELSQVTREEAKNSEGASPPSTKAVLEPAA